MARMRNSRARNSRVRNNFIPPNIVGDAEKEREARNSLDFITNSAITGADEDYPEPSTSGRRLSAIDTYTRQLQKLLRGGGYRKPFDDLTSQLNTMGTQAQSTIGNSMDQLQTFLQGQKNPFEGMVAQQTAVQPDLASLLQSQGVSTDPLQQYANTVNTQNAGQATAMQNLMNTLGGLQSASQAGALADVETNRANLQSQLGATQMGMGAQIGQQATGQQQQLMQLLLDALSKGGRPRGGRLF